ncbi:hypothetical protein [Arabidopsis thaliana]|nr:Cysteine/Histidine-rich C1 domain family protein [Arabidopsis thaliana]AAG51151.1 hypothetical protein [Arabidopsis thaliana]AEE34510.1 Cysteine/Histidine-rich C1 domain family protein [Arabidopsis thaliana]|eukprot:NP_176818.1 Cysteine/Histidine-rich C1 domain family protein [Arabidopsis thaliana]
MRSLISLFSQLISLINSMDLDSQPEPEPESGIIFFIYQLISFGRSLSGSKPERQIILLVTEMISLISSTDPKQEPEPEVMSLTSKTLSSLYSLDPYSELQLLIAKTFSFVELMDSDSDPEADAERESERLISLCPQFEVELVQGKFRVAGKFEWRRREKGKCNPGNRKVLRLRKGAEITHFFCRNCIGEEHDVCDKAPLEVKHPLHPRHSLQLVLWWVSNFQKRKCYCCDEELLWIFYFCSACDCGMNIACVEKKPLLSIDHPEWHEHILSLFPRQAPLPCSVCALPHSRSTFYICSPCQFIVHQSCINLPSVIRISRHLHRISFIRSFDQGDWSCGVCRRKIYNDYGGYSCINDDCSYAAHSTCATQSNVWDGNELKGKPEEIDGEGVEPYVSKGNGIIQHFSHQQHYLSLDENTGRDNNENKLCQACITPIYSGKFYSCMKCNFILHEECANFSRKIHHPIHPHMLTLMTPTTDRINIENSCSACPWLCTTGFFYECDREGCRFILHVQCSKISEPLVHESHMHPLFLTSRPGERKHCDVCKKPRDTSTSETFNCNECVFSLCFKCAAIPYKVRYKHDKHMLTLSYGNETSMLTHWCEVCEGKINPKYRFYRCDEYCCVTLHMECLLGLDLYMTPGLSLFHSGATDIDVLPNNRMSRPICKTCNKRCPFKVVFQCSGFKFCSRFCLLRGIWTGLTKIA